MTNPIKLDDPIFTDAYKARAYLEAQRWPDGPICPHCGAIDDATGLQGKAHRAGVYQCNSCREQFSVTVGTVFERSKIPLNKWLHATFLMTSSKKGMSAHQLSRMLAVTYKTAWFMAHRIRTAMAEGNPGPLGGEGKTIEADETYIGNKAGSERARTKKRAFNLIEALSVHIVCYNMGTVQSAANLIFVCGDERYATPGSTFFFHQTYTEALPNQRLTNDFIRERLKSQTYEDQRAAAIYSKKTGLPIKTVRKWQNAELVMDTKAAIQNNLITAVKTLTIPPDAYFHQVIV